jgi:hypothetical protein
MIESNHDSEGKLLILDGRDVKEGLKRERAGAVYDHELGKLKGNQAR